MVVFLWPLSEQTRQRILFLRFAGQCWLWRLSSLITFAAAALGRPSVLGGGGAIMASSSFLDQIPHQK